MASNAVCMTRRVGPAVLILEDGTTYTGYSRNSHDHAYGEVVFNTSMSGYQEILTDPSYCGQIVVLTYPEIGIYGVNAEDSESQSPAVAGFAVSRLIAQPSNYRASETLPSFLARNSIPVIEGIDTRALTRHLRSKGTMRGVLVFNQDQHSFSRLRIQDHQNQQGTNLVEMVSPPKSASTPRLDSKGERIILVDCGSKAGIERELIRHAGPSMQLLRVRHDASPGEVLSLRPDGVILSNGPGDPEPLLSTIKLVSGLLEERIPLGGICLGHQILGLAIGGKTYKMRFGHHGSNHPVREEATKRVLITSQNHGFAVDPTSLGICWAPLDSTFTPAAPALVPAYTDAMRRKSIVDCLPGEALVGSSPVGFGPIEVTHLSLNDGTLEGMKLLDRPAMSVQFHPEASPGPHDSVDFFGTFLKMVGETHA